MLVTSHLSRFFAPLAIVAISIALSSTASAQCSGSSCGQPTGLGYAPAFAPVVEYNSGWTNSYASGPVFTSAPISASYAPVQLPVTNSIPVQSFLPAPQPIQTAAPTYVQPIAIQAAPVPYSAPAVSFPVAQPVWHSAQPQSGCANGRCPLR